MDKATLAALVGVGVAIVFAGVTGWTSCISSREASEPGEPGRPAVCLATVPPGALVLTGLLCLAGFGVWTERPGVAWASALVALAGSVLFGFSLGRFIFPALGVCYIVGLWHMTRPGQPGRWSDRRRIARATASAVIVFMAFFWLNFVPPLAGLLLIVAGIAGVAGLATFLALASRRSQA